MIKHPFVNCNSACHRFDWENVFKNHLPQLTLNTKHQPCPCCGGKDRFRLFADWPETGGSICNQCGHCDGIGLLMKYWNQPFVEVMRALAGEQTTMPVRKDSQRAKPRSKQDEQNKRSTLTRCLQNGKPLNKSQPNAATQYLTNRGLGVLLKRNHHPDNLFYLSDMLYKQSGEADQLFSGLMAAVHDVNGNLVGAHRIYLSADGHKAPVSTPKKSLPPIYEGAMNGAAVRLYPATDKVCIAEGIETALAVRCMRPGLGVWATLTAGGMETLRLPAEIGEVQIFVDHDKNGRGLEAGNVLAARLRKEGRQVKLYSPEGRLNGAFGDWLDVWVEIPGNGLPAGMPMDGDC